MILWIRLSSDFSFLVVTIWSEFENVPSVGGTLPFSRSGFCWSGNEKSDLKTNLCYLLLEKKMCQTQYLWKQELWIHFYVNVR